MGKPKSPLFVIKGGGATAAPTESDLFRNATATKEDLEADLHGAGAVTKVGVPTTWANADGSAVVRGEPTQVITPSAQQIEAFKESPRAVCGHCKYFDLENGRKEIVRQRFAERLVHDQEWKLKHLGGPPDSIGLCGASGGELATTFVSKACDQYREK